MASLWATGDNQTAKRRNREAFRGLLIAPSFDVDNSQAVTVTVVPIDGDDIVQTETIHYTAPSTTILHTIQVTNVHSVARTVRVHLVQSGGARSTSNQVLALSFQPGQTSRFRGCWAMSVGDSLRSIATSTNANEVVMGGVAIEFSYVIEGIEIMPPVFSNLTTGLVQQYVCPSSLVAAAHTWITVVNADTAGRSVTVELRPSGQSTGARYTILKRDLVAGETVDLGGPDDPIVLQPGDAIYGSASLDGVVAMRTTAIEYSSTP